MISKAENENQTGSVQEIFDFLNECGKNFQLGEQKDVVVVLGNTGSGKSTLTLLLTGAKLIAVETDDGSGEFVIKDENNIVSPPDQSTQSQTIIPNLRIDNDTHTTYYDCAGFEDSRGVKYDLSVTYLIQKLLKFANSVKFIFTIAYSSVRVGGDRHDFKKLVRHGTDLIKNVDKYQNSISLIVTKVESKLSGGKIVPDEKTINVIGKFVSQTKSDLNSEEPQRKINMEKFIDSLLQQQNGTYNRIQIIRSPTEQGIFNEMEFPKQERQAIRSMLNNTLEYTSKANDDFGYSISADSKLKVHELIEKLELHLFDDVVGIGNEIHEFYAKQATQTLNRQILINNLLVGNDKLSQVNANDLDLFKEQLFNATNSIHINLSAESVNDFQRHIEFLHYFESVSDGKLSKGFKISDALKNVTEYLMVLKEQYKSELIIELKANLTNDIANINVEIKSFYLKKEAEITDINQLNQFMLEQLNVFSTVTFKDPEEFQRKLVEIINSCHIQINSDILNSLLQHIEVIRFIESLNTATSSIKIEIENGLSTTIQYLSSSRDWCQFIIKLENELAQFKVQQNVAGFNPSDLIQNINKLIAQTEINNSEVLFKDTGIKEFVDRINVQINAELESLQINSIKLKSINKLLQQSMLTPIASSCTDSELIVKGYNVKMSDIINVQCQANLIKVMAINKIFIDANINKPGTQLQIIAPTWEMVGEHLFEINGAHAETICTNPPPVASGVAGNSGQPGNPGHQGGHLFGIGDTFINGEILKVFSNGGNGGNGQNGGNGNICRYFYYELSFSKI